MANVVEKLPLFDDTFYSYTVPLEGSTYKLQLLYLERLSHWIISIKDSEGVDLVVGQRLTPNTRLFFGYGLGDLTGYFVFTPKADVDPQEIKDSIRQISDFYDLFYVYDDGE